MTDPRPIPSVQQIEAAYAMVDQLNEQLNPLGFRVPRQLVAIDDRFGPNDGDPPASPVTAPNSDPPDAPGTTGAVCTECGGSRMQRMGTCETCLDCATTTGCG